MSTIPIMPLPESIDNWIPSEVRPHPSSGTPGTLQPAQYVDQLTAEEVSEMSLEDIVEYMVQRIEGEDSPYGYYFFKVNIKNTGSSEISLGIQCGNMQREGTKYPIDLVLSPNSDVMLSFIGYTQEIKANTGQKVYLGIELLEGSYGPNTLNSSVALYQPWYIDAEHIPLQGIQLFPISNIYNNNSKPTGEVNFYGSNYNPVSYYE